MKSLSVHLITLPQLLMEARHCYDFVLNVFFGIIVTLYFIIVLRKKAVDNINKSSSSSLSVKRFYLNVFVLNKDEAVANVVKSKMVGRSDMAVGESVSD